MNFDWMPIVLSLKLAVITTIVLFVIGVPLAYWLAFTQKRWRIIIDPLVSLPLVLPPTVIGFYLLLLMSPQSFFGKWMETVFNIRLVFSFSGLVIGSVIFSLPFMVNTVKSGFQSIPVSLIESSYTLGKSRWETFLQVLTPINRPAILSGIIMTFAHTLGEFGVVLMVGGNIPRQTRTASIAIYNEFEALNYATAHMYSFVLIIISFVILIGVNSLTKNKAKVVA